MTGQLAPYEAGTALLDAMQAAGVVPRDRGAVHGALLGGGIVRFACQGERHRNGWAVLRVNDGLERGPAGAFGNWRLGITGNWRAKHGAKTSQTDMAAIAARQAKEREAREAGYRKAESKARWLWQASQAARDDHPYLVSKRLALAGSDGSCRLIVLRQAGDDLLVPLQTLATPMCNIQRIGPDGSKRFLYGGRLASAFWCAGKAKGAPIIAVGEGFATMAAIHLATGLPVAAAMSANNLEAVALALSNSFPAARLILCADMDAGAQGNIGLAKANAAAAAVPGALVARPPRPAVWPVEGKSWDFADTFKAPGGADLIRCALGMKEIELTR